MFIEYITSPNEALNISNLEFLPSDIRVLNVREELNSDDEKFIKTLVSFPRDKSRIFLNRLD